LTTNQQLKGEKSRSLLIIYYYLNNDGNYPLSLTDLTIAIEL